MAGSPLSRTAAFAALLTVILVGWEQCASRDLRGNAVAQLDASLEQTAQAVVEELDGLDLEAVPFAQLNELAHRAARVAGVRVTLIDAAGTVRADSDVYDASLGSIESHAQREEVIAAAS